MAEPGLIEVEVAYALPQRQLVLRVRVAEGASALEAARASAIDRQFPELVLDENCRLGIYGQAVAASHVLRAGDRVEIYRPLLADPRERRRARARRAPGPTQSEDSRLADSPSAETSGSAGRAQRGR